jgi:hypothetical protein
MKNLFIPYEQALVLKGLGFDETSLANYGDSEDGIQMEIWNDENHYKWKTICPAPTYQQVFKWFREKHNLWNMIYPRYDWNFNIQYIKDFDSVEDKGWGTEKESFHGSKFRTYEEAEFACLKKLIEIVKK